MGLWGAIQKTLNSTVGTADFKPLDKIIEGQRTLAASDSVIQVLCSNGRVTSSYQDFGEFIPKVSGSVRIIADISNSVSDRYFYIQILKNGSVSASIREEIASLTRKNLSLNVSVLANEKYTVQMKTGDVNGDFLNSIAIGAQIVDTSLVEVI